MSTIEVLKTCRGFVEQEIENKVGVAQAMLVILLDNINAAISREEGK